MSRSGADPYGSALSTSCCKKKVGSCKNVHITESTEFRDILNEILSNRFEDLLLLVVAQR